MSQDGNGAQKAGSHTVLWWGLALVAVPVLYLLTALLVVVLVLGPVPATRTKYSTPAAAPPNWLMIYVAPAEWVASRTPFENPYQVYCSWCFKEMGR
jgi:hypothetical protein